MKEYWQKFVAQVPMPFAGALLLVGALWGFVAWDQSHWWKVKEDYGFGWLVPAFVAYVLYERWPKITEAVAACAARGSARWSGRGLSVGAGLLLVSGAGLYLLGAFYRAGLSVALPSTLAITAGTAAMVLATLFLHAPEGEAPMPVRRLWDDARIKLMALFVFPTLVWLVSAPMISVVEQNLNLFLLQKVTSVVFFVFDFLGMPIEQQGNVLMLPPLADGKPNQVGVEDACSGIRSLTACLFAGSFLASVFLDKLWKKIALVAASMCFAVFTNLLRGIFLTSWAYNYGHESIEGFVHDTAGYAVLGLTVAGLLCLLPLFNLRITFGDAELDDPEGTGTDGVHKRS
jgi:exosortase